MYPSLPNRRSWFWCGILSCLLATTISLSGAESSASEKRLFTFGQKAMDDHLYELAETQFQKLLSDFPQSDYRDEASWLLARARLNQGRAMDALDLLQTRLAAASIAWQDAYLFYIGEAQLKAELPVDALQTFGSLSARFPKSKYAMDAQYGVARAFLQQQKYEAAQEVLRLLQKEGSSDLAARATLTLGTTYVMQKKYDQAAGILTRLAKEESQNAVGFQALYALGEMDLERKQPDVAKSRFEIITRSDRPEAQSVVPSALFRLGELDVAAQNFAGGASSFEQAFRKSDDASFRLNCVRKLEEIYLREKKVDTLVDRLADWEGENARTRLGESLLLEIGTLWQKAGKYDQAIRAMQAYFDKYPAGALGDRAHFQLGWIFLNDKKHESAALEFQKAAERAGDPGLQIDAWLKLGDLHFEREEFEKAAAAYMKAYQVKGGAVGGRREQALYQAANAFFRGGYHSQGFQRRAAHDAALAVGAWSPEVRVLEAEANRRSGEMQKVAEAYQRLIQQYPSSSYVPRTWIDEAEVLYALGKYQESMDTVKLFVEKYPKHELVPRALLCRARNLERLGQNEKAVAEFEALVKNHPKSPSAFEAQFWLGSYYDRAKNYARAEEQFELLRKNAPMHPMAPEATYFAAMAAYRLGQNKGDAARLIEALVRDYPQSPWVFDGRFLYADLLSEQGKFDEALLILDDLLKSGEKMQSDDRLLEIQGRRGQCLRQMKRYDDALASFKIIVNSPKADASLKNQAYVEMGRTYEKTGDLKLAMQSYLTPLYERNPQSTSAEEREFFWVCKGGLEAVRILELQKDWKGSVRVLKRILDSNLPCETEASAHLRKLQTEHADAN